VLRDRQGPRRHDRFRFRPGSWLTVLLPPATSRRVCASPHRRRRPTASPRPRAAREASELPSPRIDRPPVGSDSRR
jgi:hypothetical protein